MSLFRSRSIHESRSGCSELLALFRVLHGRLQSDLHGAAGQVALQRDVVAGGPPDGEVRDLDGGGACQLPVGPSRGCENGVEGGSAQGLGDVVDEDDRVALVEDGGDPLSDLVFVLGLAERRDVLPEGQAAGGLHEASLSRASGRRVDGEEGAGPVDGGPGHACEKAGEPGGEVVPLVEGEVARDLGEGLQVVAALVLGGGVVYHRVGRAGHVEKARRRIVARLLEDRAVWPQGGGADDADERADAGPLAFVDDGRDDLVWGQDVFPGAVLVGLPGGIDREARTQGARLELGDDVPPAGANGGGAFDGLRPVRDVDGAHQLPRALEDVGVLGDRGNRGVLHLLQVGRDLDVLDLRLLDDARHGPGFSGSCHVPESPHRSLGVRAWGVERPTMVESRPVHGFPPEMSRQQRTTAPRARHECRLQFVWAKKNGSPSCGGRPSLTPTLEPRPRFRGFNHLPQPSATTARRVGEE